MANLYSQLDSHCIHGGHLYKKGVYNRAWKKRYFVLYDDRTISYFEKEKHAKSRNKAKGSIHLTQISRVEFVNYVDPTVVRTKSQLNEIFTNDTHCVDPTNKHQLRQNSMRQNNYIHRTNSHHVHHSHQSSLDLKARTKLKPKTRADSPSISYTTDDLAAMAVRVPPSKHLEDEEIMFSPESIVAKRKRLNKFNSGWCVSPQDLPNPLNPIHSGPQSSPSSTEDGNIVFPARHRKRSSTIGEIPRSHSTNPSLDKLPPKHSHHRPQSADAMITPWSSVHDSASNKSDDDEALPANNPASNPLRKKKSTLHLPRPPPRKSFGKSNSDAEDEKEIENNQNDDNNNTPKEEDMITTTHSLPLNDTQITSKDIIVSDTIRKYKRELNHELSQSMMSKDTELHLHSQVLETTTSDLSADRRYSFALIQADRNWILSAETEHACNNWLQCLQLLVQGRRTYSGHLIKRGKNVKSWKKRYFVLFENKVLNYYHNKKDKGALIGDIDLRHTMWLRICKKNEFTVNISDFFNDSKPKHTKKRKSELPNKRSVSINLRRHKRKRGHQKSNSWGKKGPQHKKQQDSYLFEIATPNRTWLFCAKNETIRNTWYAQIRDVFSDKLMLKIYFDSLCHLQIIHMGQNLKNRYAALLKGWLIIFRDKNKLNDVRCMTFFSDTIFRDYVRNKNCMCIPLKNAHIVQNFKSTCGQWSFQIEIQDRCWYFNVESEEILNQWLKLLTQEHVDYSRVEQSYSNMPMPACDHSNNGDRAQASNQVTDLN